MESDTNVVAGSWLIAGFAGLGSLIGFISGLSSAAVTLPLMAALFALVSGGIAPYAARAQSALVGVTLGKSLLAFCLACGLLLVVGIWVREHSILAGPAGAEQAAVLKSSLADVRGLCLNEQYEALGKMIGARR